MMGLGVGIILYGGGRIRLVGSQFSSTHGLVVNQALFYN
jgi:hypothetical protein